MTIITNKKRLVVSPFNAEVLNELAKTLTENAVTLLNLKPEEAIFTVVEAELYPYIENVSDLTFEELQTISKPSHEVKMRAFENAETISLPKKQTKTYTHELTREEKEKLADQMCDDLEAKDNIEDEKKAANDDFNKRIKDLDARISLNGAAHKSGTEERTVSVTVELDFDKKKKYYRKEGETDILLTEPLDDFDYQMKLDLTGIMFQEDDPNVFGHSRLEENRELYKAQDKVKISKGTDQSDFPHTLIINGDSFGYATSETRDEDYKLARKEFSKAKMKVVKDETEDEIRPGVKDWDEFKREEE